MQQSATKYCCDSCVFCTAWLTLKSPDSYQSLRHCGKRYWTAAMVIVWLGVDRWRCRHVCHHYSLPTVFLCWRGWNLLSGRLIWSLLVQFQCSRYVSLMYMCINIFGCKYTLCLKKVSTFKLSVTLSNLNHFQNFCIAEKCIKFATKPIQQYSTYLRHVVTQGRMGFVANFIRFPTVQKFWKSVNIWQSCREFKGGNFFWDTVYSQAYVRNVTAVSWLIWAA